MLRRWGLLDQVIACGCPPVPRFRFDYGPVVLAGSPPPLDGGAECYAPRRTILDTILVQAAEQAGAEVRPAFTVDALTCQRAVLEPPTPQMSRLLAALCGNQDDTDQFIGVIAGTVPVAEFFAPGNIQRITGAASTTA